MATDLVPSRFTLTENCPVCTSRRLRSFKKGTLSARFFDETKLKTTYGRYGEVWALGECLDCGHLFANPVPDREFLLSLYARVEDAAYDEESFGRSHNFLRLLKTLEDLAPAKGALFDAGAASGLFLHLARERGWSVSGVEASAWSVRFAKIKYGLDLIPGALEDLPSSLGPFRAVTMIDLIEHTPVPRAAVAKAYKILAPGGVLCVVTPDIRSFTARLAGKRWWHLRPGHIAYFSAKSLETLLRRAGFTISRRKRYVWTFSLHYVLSRISPFSAMANHPQTASFLKRFRIKLALRDSFEIYAMKESRP
jgi:2-polyprenyl-3-methyl-5-hydroxy-6-metoxy-1,4-benzoquinol methylase